MSRTVPTSASSAGWEHASAKLRGLAHPLRLRIVALLHEQEASPSAIARATGESINLVVYHCRALTAAGLIRQVRERHRGGTVEHIFGLADDAVRIEDGEDGPRLTVAVCASGAR